jgi:hypothetical protein
MPSISKIRFTNVVYEDGMKRYNDEIFHFDGYNGAVILENGGGKTVFIQTALQAILPHTNLSDRKIKQTLQLDNYPAHIAIEWILGDNPRRYLVTCVSLFLTKDGLGSYRYVYPYLQGDRHGIDGIPFVRKDSNRPSDRGEISDYYQQMTQQNMDAHTFQTIKAFQHHIEEQYHIITTEWESIVRINSTEGGVEAFFDECKQTNQLLDRLLIPTVEGAIAGHKQNSFADTFEKHRGSFKLYKELKEQIEENKLIEEELNAYVESFEKLHKQEQKYGQDKQHAKAVMDLINRQIEDNETSQLNIKSAFENWETLSLLLEKHALSLQIQKEEMKLDECSQELQRHRQILNEGKTELSQTTKDFYSLKLAELEMLHRIEEENLQRLQEQLMHLDKDEDTEEIRDQLDANSQEICAYFVHELEESQKRTQNLKIQQQPLQNEIDRFNTQKKNQEAELQEVIKGYSSNNGKIEQLTILMNQIRNRILANPQQQAVNESVRQWEIRLVVLDKEIVQLKNHNKQLREMLILNREKLVEILNTKQVREEKRIKLKSKIDQIDMEHVAVLQTLGKLRSQWGSIESIYLKQDSLTHQLKDEVERIDRKREEFLYKERIAHRFKDDYEDQGSFFADPYVEKQLIQWGNQFDLIETGVQFIQSLGNNCTEYAKAYSLWPSTLITTEGNKEALMKKIYHINQQLQFPIMVISIEQASSIVRGENIDFYPVVPSHWSENQQDDLFNEWKEGIKGYAEDSTKDRKTIEENLKAWQNGVEKLVSFLQRYPFPVYQELKTELSKLYQQTKEADAEQKELERKEKEWNEQLDAQLIRIEEDKSEFNGLQGKVKDARDYLQYEKESNGLKLVQEEHSKHIVEFERSIKKINDQIIELSTEKNRIYEQGRDETLHQLKLQEDSLYREVKNHRPSFTQKPIAVLTNIREELILALRSLSRTRNEIQLQLTHANKEIKRLLTTRSELLLDHGPLNEGIDFPANGQMHISGLRERIKKLKLVEEGAFKQYQETNEIVMKQENKVETFTSQFLELFPGEEVVRFSEPILEVAKQINEKKKKLAEQKKYLLNEEGRIDKELDSLRQAYHTLDRLEEAHHFNGPSVIPSILATDEVHKFTYGQIEFVEKVTNQLKQGSEEVNKERNKVQIEKETFKSFCRSKITNIKMRDMALQGVNNKTTYSEIVEFHAHMNNRIQTVIKYNEESIINHDKELEQYVLHINNHLRTLAEEISLIPRKTKVKVEDKWKDIYKISIPEWTEEEGKNRIRQHIEWIITQLELERFLNTQGQEDYGKVRQEIETWTHSKQLLRVVMNQNTIKISCRKVTNDNQVTTRFYSWEQSNVWSGGEKWSKNMALFLGILSYTAEKQKHKVTNLKRHRVVIMDNPFGKASSDHVLNPVFFIAEQLGFQIIALTAHAEGKFLKDYFPVIYSCRLRNAIDSNKQIMTTEKQLHQAYFRDHEPHALERLGEVEQMELF